jgi:putative copper resistance protein D
VLLAHAGTGDVAPLTAGRILLGWHLEPLALAGLLLAAALYVCGVFRLAGQWPRARTASFLVGGLGSIAVATCSGLEYYDDVLFSAHMAQHMVLSMVAPVFLALGAPVTLALRALPVGGRRALLAALHSRAGRVVSHPVLGTFLFVVSPFALYFTPMYEATLRSPWLHLLLHVHFVVVGCLFLWPVLGLDPLPRRITHPLRLVLVFVTLPFHAFLGIAIMSSGLLAAGYYSAVARTWGGTPLQDQHLGGGLLWASGDLVTLLLLGTVGVQWMRADERAARREDRRLDREEALAAYTSRLAALGSGPTPKG